MRKLSKTVWTFLPGIEEIQDGIKCPRDSETLVDIMIQRAAISKTNLAYFQKSKNYRTRTKRARGMQFGTKGHSQIKLCCSKTKTVASICRFVKCNIIMDVWGSIEPLLVVPNRSHLCQLIVSSTVSNKGMRCYPWEKTKASTEAVAISLQMTTGEKSYHWFRSPTQSLIKESPASIIMEDPDF